MSGIRNAQGDTVVYRFGNREGSYVTQDARCGYKDCDRGGRVAGGFCTGHRGQIARGVPLGPLMPNRSPVCTYQDCNEPHKALGFCNAHYYMTSRGIPLVALSEWARRNDARTRGSEGDVERFCEFCKQWKGEESWAAKDWGMPTRKQCRSCKQVPTKEWARRNPERRKAMEADYRRRRKIRVEAGELEPYRHDPEKMRDYTLRHKFGIDSARYDEMLRSQGGVCAICRNPPSEGRYLSVDHDHSCCAKTKTCGRCIRGLLCVKCNSALGFTNESFALLDALGDYMRKYGVADDR